MNYYEFADKYLHPYTDKGNELIAEICPFCHGGDHHDKYTFALNTEKGVYKCLRGSCNKSGHFSELCRAFGETADQKGVAYIKPAYIKKQYKLPNAVINSPVENTTAYLNTRKITAATMEAFGIGTSADGKMVFPFYRNSEDFREHKPTFIKYREPRKIQPGEAKMRAESGAEPILFGLHLCDPTRDILYLCEGEIDCLSVYQASGGAINIVSVPTGASGFTWMETCSDILDNYSNIGIFADNDTAGQKMVSDIVAKLGDEKTIFIPDFSVYREAKDMNELLYRHGPEAIADVLSSMQPQPITGLLDLADIRATDMTQIGRMITGIPALDKALGGLFDGDLSILTGRRGEGKSSFLNQLTVESVSQGKNVCVYSGEVPSPRLKHQINICAAGRENITSEIDTLTGRTNYRITHKVLVELESWYRRKVWIYDNRAVEIPDERENIIRLFTRAYKQFDCRLFIIDNLMCVSQNVRAGDTLQEAANFALKLRKFADTCGVHVILAAHPRKGATVTDADEISGLGTIPNLACDVFSICKHIETDGGFIGTGPDDKPLLVQHNAELRILKNRDSGQCGTIQLMYDSAARRFVQFGLEPKKYSWQREHWESVDDIPPDL